MDIDLIAEMITDDPDVLNEIIDTNKYQDMDIVRKFIMKQRPPQPKRSAYGTTAASDPEWERAYRLLAGKKGSTPFVLFALRLKELDEARFQQFLQYLATLSDDYIIKSPQQHKSFMNGLKKTFMPPKKSQLR